MKTNPLKQAPAYQLPVFSKPTGMLKSSPFDLLVAGSHIPQNIQHVIAVEGLVHGDIRLLNMVFSDDASALIDFDYGGERGKTTYPVDYRQKHTDGRRSFAIAGEIVTEAHDVAVFVKVLDLVLAVSDALWIYLIRGRSSSPTIDELISGMRHLEKNGQWSLNPWQYLRDFLEKHTKLIALLTKASLPGN